MPSDSREERQARSLALEKAYVHDVYDQIAPHFTDTRYRAWPRVKQFLLDLEPASLVADVGCGNGKYLDANPEVATIGSDRCGALSEAARARGHEVVTCDALQLPYKDESFDAALSVAVIHHFATTDRRVAALKELSRVLRIGGKVLITVWAMEQRHRKFDSQDVLVPWHEPAKSSSDDRGSSVEREVTSTTTSDDDVLVYHAYSHISDSEHPPPTTVNRRRQKFRNGRGRYRSAGSFEHHSCAPATANSSQSSSELSSPNETCYSFVRRALQKLSTSASTAPYTSASPSRKSNPRPYFYRSCRKPCISDSMEFGPNLQEPDHSSPRNDLIHQSSIDSECQDHQNEDDVPIELRHLEGYESCIHCGSPVRETGRVNRCETNVCASCLPIDPDSGGKKSRSLGDFLNMIPKLLRVKKYEKEPLSDLHKRISTASDPREYVVKSRGANVNGIVRSKSTVSFMSRLEEIMSLSVASDKVEFDSVSNESSGSRNKVKPPRLPSLSSTTLIDRECSVILHETDMSTNPRRYTSPADALRRLRQEASLEEATFATSKVKDKQKTSQQSNDMALAGSQTAIAENINSSNNAANVEEQRYENMESSSKSDNNESIPSQTSQRSREEDGTNQPNLSSYYSMPELYKLTEDQIPEDSMFVAQRERHISFYEQAQTVLGDSDSATGAIRPRRHDSSPGCSRERTLISMPQRGLVKRSLSVDTGDNSSSSHQCPRRFSASAAQGVLASALRTYSLPRSSSRGSSVKSDTSIDSEESIVSVIPRKGNSITSDTSVDSEESVVSVIQRSTSEIETLVRENGLRNNISRLGSRSARASPVTVLSNQTSSAESSPPQSGKNDGKFPGSGGVIDQLMQQQQQTAMYSDTVHFRHDTADYLQRARRSLLRPISDPKIEERFTCGSEEGFSFFKSSGRQTPGSNRSSLESDDQVIKEDDEKNEPEVKLSSIPSTSLKTSSISANKEETQTIKSETSTGDLSRTPSPIGPIKYVIDPLITGIDPAINIFKTSNVTKTVQMSCSLDTYEIKTENQHSAEPEISSNECPNTTETEILNSNAEREAAVTSFQEVLSRFTQLSKACQDEPILEPNKHESQVFISDQASTKELQAQDETSEEEEESTLSTTESEKTTSDATAVDSITKVPSPSPASESNIKHETRNSGDRYEALSRLSQRLENLGLSSDLLKSFYMPTNTHAMCSDKSLEIGDCRNPESHQSYDKKISEIFRINGDSARSSSPLNCDAEEILENEDDDSTTEESSCSVIQERKGAEGKDDDKNVLTPIDVTDIAAAASYSNSPSNLTRKEYNSDTSETEIEIGQQTTNTDSEDSKQKEESDVQIKHISSAEKRILAETSKASSNINKEHHSKITNIRSGFKKRLRRSCVTIDEVECREVASSEDTSPSSSASLEWNDFDKMEVHDTDSTMMAAGCSTSNPRRSKEHREEMIVSPEDVNVAESEHKFNVFLDKEICVFFETPSSSIGKSASSSSNATDFSTTSDRIRGVMQREKSDDRSSKESDSDNLSKLSDLEGKSDSAFSEDFARRAELASSSSSASLEMIDSIRSKLGNDSSSQSWSEYDVGPSSSKEKQASTWVLDNIDEIPDDDKHVDLDVECDERTRMKVCDWSDDKSLNFAQRRENFFSCAADCRDMYRISFDDPSPTNDEPLDLKDQELKAERIHEAAVVPAPLPLVCQPEPAKELEGPPTDILAALVETIADLSSLLRGVFPRHDGKFDDVSPDGSVVLGLNRPSITESSSDDSVEISAFERILTFRDQDPRTRRKDTEEVKLDDEDEKDRRFSGKRTASSSGTKSPLNNMSRRVQKETHNEIERKADNSTPKKHNDNGSLKHVEKHSVLPNQKRQNIDGDVKANPKNKDSEKSLEKPDVTTRKLPEELKTLNKDVNAKEIVRKTPERAKVLNRSSQSVCTDKTRQDSVEKEEDSVPTTQSAPCSPRLKPRQRSVEEVLSKNKAELSRNSSLSQSTSQESLPGNESGGLMAYHRYYHVFRQGELDNLIENYVENLHIIASYYDHANWCVVAEKVQVWTI